MSSSYSRFDSRSFTFLHPRSAASSSSGLSSASSDSTLRQLNDIPKLRILVLGDSGSGKSTFLHYFTQSNGSSLLSALPSSPSSLIPLESTIGCEPLISLHHSAFTGSRVFIEFFDVGCHRKYENSRDLYYTQLNGILLFFDCGNRKSYENVKKWIKEIVGINSKKQGIEEKSGSRNRYTAGSSVQSQSQQIQYGMENRLDNGSMTNSSSSATGGAWSSLDWTAELAGLPVLCVGNKADLFMKPSSNSPPRSVAEMSAKFDCMKDYGLESIFVSSINPAEIETGPGTAHSAAADAAPAASSASSKDSSGIVRDFEGQLSRFHAWFDRVLDRKTGLNASNGNGFQSISASSSSVSGQHNPYDSLNSLNSNAYNSIQSSGFYDDSQASWAGRPAITPLQSEASTGIDYYSSSAASVGSYGDRMAASNSQLKRSINPVQWNANAATGRQSADSRRTDRDRFASDYRSQYDRAQPRTIQFSQLESLDKEV